MSKSVVQVFLISLSKTVGKEQILAHHITYITIVGSILLYGFRQRAFNYDIMNLWHKTSLICIVWLAILNFIEYLTRETLVLAILLFVGWFLIFIVGYVIKKKLYTNMLYFEPNTYLK
jgi:hypothetical protein